MLKSNYLYNKLVELCDINGIAPSIWAEKNNLNNALPTLLKRGVRPNPSTLNKLITSFKNPEDRMELMAAHLKDEIIRGGLSLNVIYPTISSKKKYSEPDLDLALQTISDFAQNQPIRDFVIRIAALLRVSEGTYMTRRELETSAALMRTGAPNTRSNKHQSEAE